jgi:hypothetical protein
MPLVQALEVPLHNLVETIEEGLASGKLVGKELLIFTNNAMAEGAFYKGNTGSNALFNLVLQLRTMDMRGSFWLHVIHVAGSGMIQQGTDGLSWGDYSSGVVEAWGLMHSFQFT